LAYEWLNRSSQQQAINATGHSSKTVTAFYNHFRKLVATTLDEEDQTIGGPGVIVEVDETKLGKRKYNRGHGVEGAWILVGVERTEDQKVFLKHIEDRTANTLLEEIKAHVAPGSIIYIDKWKAYDRIKTDVGLEHVTVNHSLNFKDPLTQVHTNTVKGTNNGLKILIRPRNRTADGIEGHLLEFVWRRKNAPNLWGGFLAALVDIHYDLE
jgi:transposase-like protein